MAFLSLAFPMESFHTTYQANEYSWTHWMRFILSSTHKGGAACNIHCPLSCLTLSVHFTQQVRMNQWEESSHPNGWTQPNRIQSLQQHWAGYEYGVQSQHISACWVMWSTDHHWNPNINAMVLLISHRTLNYKSTVHKSIFVYLRSAQYPWNSPPSPCSLGDNWSLERWPLSCRFIQVQRYLV